MPWFAFFLSLNHQTNFVNAPGTSKNGGVPSFVRNGAREGLQLNFGRISTEPDRTGSVRANKMSWFNLLDRVAYAGF